MNLVQAARALDGPGAPLPGLIRRSTPGRIEGEIDFGQPWLYGALLIGGWDWDKKLGKVPARTCDYAALVLPDGRHILVVRGREVVRARARMFQGVPVGDLNLAGDALTYALPWECFAIEHQKSDLSTAE